MGNTFSLKRLFPRSSGSFLLFLVICSQVIGLLGALPGFFSVHWNADFNERQVRLLSINLPIFLMAGFAVLLYINWRLTPYARMRLNEFAAKSVTTKPDLELNAWREITSLSWKTGLWSVFVNFGFIVLPAFLITASQAKILSSPLQYLSIFSPAPIYILFGGIASILGSALLTVFLLDHFTQPLRTILLPGDFDAQIKGRSGPLLNRRIPILVITMITIAVLLLAPMNYQQTVNGLSGKISSLEDMSAIRTQFILISLLTLALGGIYSYYFSRSVSVPVKELISSLNQIEKGELNARAQINAADELGILSMRFNRMVTRLEELQNSLERQVVERTNQFAATYEVGRAVSSSLDPNEILARAINLFTEQFGYYHAAIYLVDPSGKWAELKAASGEASAILKQDQHRLEVFGKSLVGSSIREKTARIAQLVSEEKQRIEAPLLPRTRSEIALPLLVSDRVQGVLNIHSTEESDFQPERIETMQKMASQVANAIENARLYQDAQQSIRELRAIQQQYVLTGWSGFSEKDESLGYGVGDESDGSAKKMDVEITLRDQVLGNLRLESNHDWSPDQIRLVNAVAAQAAIALENARLVSESRKIAAQERMLTDINSKIWSSATIDGVLQTVVKELGRRLDATSASIELNIDKPQ